MTGILQFVPVNQRFMFGMLVCLLYIFSTLIFFPYEHERNGTLSLWCEVIILLFLLAGNAINSTGQLKRGSGMDILLSIIFIIITVGCVFLFFVILLIHTRQNYYRKKRKRILLNSNFQRLKSEDSQTSTSGNSWFEESVDFTLDTKENPDDIKNNKLPEKLTTKQLKQTQNIAAWKTVKNQNVSAKKAIITTFRSIQTHVKKACNERSIKKEQKRQLESNSETKKKNINV